MIQFHTLYPKITVLCRRIPQLTERTNHRASIFVSARNTSISSGHCSHREGTSRPPGDHTGQRSQKGFVILAPSSQELRCWLCFGPLSGSLTANGGSDQGLPGRRFEIIWNDLECILFEKYGFLLLKRPIHVYQYEMPVLRGSAIVQCDNQGACLFS
jgi:hypothetical protein